MPQYVLFCTTDKIAERTGKQLTNVLQRQQEQIPHRNQLEVDKTRRPKLNLSSLHLDQTLDNLARVLRLIQAQCRRKPSIELTYGTNAKGRGVVRILGWVAERCQEPLSIRILATLIFAGRRMNRLMKPLYRKGKHKI